MLDGYVCHFKAATKSSLFGRAMGGVIVLVKQCYSNHFKRINDDFSAGIILKAEKSLFDLQNDIVMIFTYLPPLNSPFYLNKSSKGIFLLEEELISVISASPSDLLMVIGDLNARCSNLTEDIHIDYNVEVLQYTNELLQCPIEEPRSSCDSTVNTSGRHLIDLCKLYSLCILNGRKGDDKGIGHYTYISPNGCSVIDYCLISYDLYYCVANFSVEEMSDSHHMPIKVALNIYNQCTTIDDNNNTDVPRITELSYKIPHQRQHEFKINVEQIFTPEFVTGLCNDIDNLNKDVNAIIHDINESLYACGTNFVKNHTNRSVNKTHGMTLIVV